MSAAKSVFLRLLDGVEPELLRKIVHAPLHIDGVQDVHEVRARWIGHRVHADIHVTVDRRLNMDQAHAITERINGSLQEHVPAFGSASIHLCPCSHPEPAPAIPEPAAL